MQDIYSKTEIVPETEKPQIIFKEARPPFRIVGQYDLFEIKDLGTDEGIKIYLEEDNKETLAKHLKPLDVKKLTDWLMKALGHPIHMLPIDLEKMLEHILNQKNGSIQLRHGDKLRIKQTLAILQKYEI